MQHLTGFAPLAERYQGFILDLWGVIHDGITPYPGAIDCLRRLKAAGKPTVLLSNAPRRAHVAQEAMRAMGIADDLYTGILTSGEATHRMLRDRPDSWFAALGARVFHLGPERDRNVMEALPLTRVETPAEASFVLNTGPDDTHSPTDIGAYEDILQACRGAGLPMVCANPDLEVIRGGTRVICAGALAQRYEAIGGTARWIGKPDPAIYTPVLAMLGVGKDQVLAVGDALRTDVAGATSVSIAACWVLGGIHAEELGADPARVEAAAAAAGLSPVAAVPAFVW
ncbi:TIGR01459 family HAD-type hydrolase [Limobrevibacterium gyesilva]|uniref:TIGR01459 family HAD-type hydrolase n=1 Tax=Limobrevibacterium gyesilva TaxID=2991712 RepID=A0AA41YQT5_9PROT|nr:TIGR01459 family HAD-type hydrolase [Limobrevibacterium gyesilva]MCW3476593.1 TIGR01459 family HAD-type hydrolase [Limobrevibacterium gyesilva]